MADDDAPLAALAKPKLKSCDDEVTLSTLAQQRTPKLTGNAAPGSKGKGRPATPATAGKSVLGNRGPATATSKRTKKSSSSSSSSSGSSSSSSEDAGGEKKQRKPRKTITAKRKVKSKEVEIDYAEDNEEKEEHEPLKKRSRSEKEKAAAELLCRWWYVLPDWPPADSSYYEAELEKMRLRRVSIEEWEWVNEEDSQARKKAYELSQFRGCFRTSDGKLVDLRPQDTKPSQQNMMKKSLSELYDLIVKAYEKQIEDLKKSPYNEDVMRMELNKKLNMARSKLHKSREVNGVKS